METNKENLRELIEKFMGSQNAQMYLDDIEAGERILREHPAPKPDDMLLANIKANITLHKVPQRTVTFRKRVFEAIAVAASIIIIAAISLQSINETPTLLPEMPTYHSSVVPEGFWTHEYPKISDIRNDLDDLDRQIVQVAMDTSDYSYDSISYDQYNKEIQQLERSLSNIGNTPEVYSYNNNSILDELEELENQFNQLNDNFWQDDYSNSDAFDI